MFDAITIGTATRDVFIQSKFFKVFRDPKHLESLGFKTGEAECFAFGSKLEVNQPVLTVGGGAANAAVTFSREGFKTAAIIKIGDDESGDSIVKRLNGEKISVFAGRNKNHGTAYSTILLSQTGERTILVYRGASESLEKGDVPFGKLQAKWAYIAPGGISFSVIRSVVDRLKKNKVKIAMNPSKHYLNLNKESLGGLLKDLDVVILNREEASYLTGIPYKNERGIFKAFDELVDGLVVMTDGSRGAKVSDGKYVYSAGIFKEKKLADRTGAGDAFGSGFVAGLMRKPDIHYAMRLASANACSVVEKIGAQEGILEKKDVENNRWRYLSLDIEKV